MTWGGTTFHIHSGNPMTINLRLHLLLPAVGVLALLAVGCSRPAAPSVDPTPIDAQTAPTPPQTEEAPPKAPSEPEKLVLRYNVTTGQKYPMEMVKDQLIEVTVRAQVLPTRRVEIIEGTWEILETNVYREFFNARFTFDRIRFSETSPRGNVVYDSASDDSPPDSDRAIILDGLVGNSIDVTITPSGRIVDMRETADMREAIIAALAAHPRFGNARTLDRARNETLSDESLSLMLETYLTTLPGTQFRIGDKWTEMRPLPDLASTNDRTIHIVRREGDSIVVHRDSVMRPVINGGTMGRRIDEQVSMVVESGEATTTSRVNAGTGWVQEAETNGLTRARLALNNGRPSTMEEPPMTTTEKVTVRLLTDGREATGNFPPEEDVE